MTDVARSGSAVPQTYSGGMGQGHEPANLGDILERVLDRGLVIAGDIQVNLLDIELLTIKLRLLIASVDTAKQLGIDWWEHDPWLTGNNRELEQENRRLRERVAALESGEQPRRAVEGGSARRERAGERADQQETGREQAGREQAGQQETGREQAGQQQAGQQQADREPAEAAAERD
jgi:hypothetical protein